MKNFKKGLILLCARKLLLLFPLIIIGAGYNTAYSQQKTLNPDEIPYNIDGKAAYDLVDLAPQDIAYVQVLNAAQAKTVFGTGYSKGVLYVTSLTNKNSQDNSEIQKKIDKLYPNPGSYRKQMGRAEESLWNAIQFAEKNNPLILIEGKESTLETLKNLPLNNGTIISYAAKDSSAEYGEKAKNGIVTVKTLTPVFIR